MILIQTVGLSQTQAQRISKLANLAFGPNAVKIVEDRSIDEAAQRGAEGDRILVLDEPSPEVLQEATSRADAEGLALWTVFAFGAQAVESPAYSLSADDAPEAIWATLLRLAHERQGAYRCRDRALGDLLSISSRVIHDLRSPLNTVQAALTLLADPSALRSEESKEITEIVCSTVNEQGNFLRLISVLTDASARPLDPLPVSMELAFSNALDRCRKAIDAAGGSIEAPSRWPDRAASGEREHFEVAWEAAIGCFLSLSFCENKLEVGWRETERRQLPHVEFWIRARLNQDRDDNETLRIIPFNRLHECPTGRDIGPSLVDRLARLYGGYSAATESDGWLSLRFGLPSAL